MYQLTGIGNAIIDIILEISEKDFAELGYEKSSMNLVEANEQSFLLEKFSNKEARMSSGGAVANSVVTATQLGLKTAYLGAFSDDKYGIFYEKDFESYGIKLSNPCIPGKTSGTSVILVTPDGERTMQTCLAVASDLSPEQIDEEVIKASDYILIEGYLLASDSAFTAVEKVVEYSKKYNKKIIIALSAPFIVEFFKERLDKVCEASTVCFANLAEAQAYTKLTDIDEVSESLSKTFSHSIVTLNKDGAVIMLNGEKYRVRSEEVKAVDSTGAGDAFCGAYLAGFIQGEGSEKAGFKACQIASRVVTQVGARLKNI